MAGSRPSAVRALLIVAGLLLAGCGTDAGDGDGDTGDATSGTGTVPAVSGPPPSTSSPGPSAPPLTATPLEPQTSPTLSSTPGFALDPTSPIVVAAVDDLATRLGIDASDVTVVEARAVTWGDSSLGCPEPGVQYLQRLVDGALVVLEAGGRRYEYHGGDPLVLCESPKPPSGG